MKKLSELLAMYRTDRPDEWTMDEFKRAAEALEIENARLQSVIDEANAQPPSWYEIHVPGSAKPDLLKSLAECHESYHAKAIRLYAHAVPAQKSVDRDTIINVLLSIGNMSEGIIADAIISAIGAQQSPAVAVHDAVSVLDKAAEGIENQIANAGLRNDLYDAGYLRAIKRELIKLRDNLSSQSPRITEQDALQIIKSWSGYFDQDTFEMWCMAKGSALLNKLNDK